LNGYVADKMPPHHRAWQVKENNRWGTGSQLTQVHRKMPIKTACNKYIC